MSKLTGQASVEWLIKVINTLPCDDPVPINTPGYNKYYTQKAHWLGWLNPDAGTGSYPRSSGDNRGARNVYNRIVEPKMLIWLISAAGVKKYLLNSAREAAETDEPMPTRSAAVRKLVPWSELEIALSSGKMGSSLPFPK